MSKPAKYPEWASSLVHVVEPSATKKSDGDLSGEQPIPQYANWLKNLVYQWVEYLDGYNSGARWRYFLPLGRPGSEINTTWLDYDSYVKNGSAGSAFVDSIPVPCEVGGTITGIAARVLGTGAGGNIVVNLWKINGDGTRTTVDTLTITTPPASWATYTLTLGTPQTVADSTSYSLDLTMPTTNQACTLLGVQVGGPG